jgi:hypothetical protein
LRIDNTDLVGRERRNAGQIEGQQQRPSLRRMCSKGAIAAACRFQRDRDRRSISVAQQGAYSPDQDQRCNPRESHHW